MELRHEDRSERRGWFARLHLSWPMLLLFGWLVYEITSQPGLAALLACAKFGWAEVRTAFWLRRVDPDRQRGRTCFWAYLTYGLWKVAVVATLSMILLGFLSDILDRARRPQQGNKDFSPVLAGALAAAMVGFGLSFPSAYIALWSAKRNGVRIWLGHAPNRACKERFWPPCHQGFNAAPLVGFTLLILTNWFIVCLAILFVFLAQPIGINPIFFWVGTAALLLLSMTFFFHLFPQVIARSPQECWSVPEEEMVQQVGGREDDGSQP